jgi:hypothetical protein
VCAFGGLSGRLGAAKRRMLSFADGLLEPLATGAAAGDMMDGVGEGGFG